MGVHEGPCACYASNNGMFRAPIAYELKKKCVKCGRELPVIAFNDNPRTKDGLSHMCIDCMHDTMSKNHKGGKPKKENPVFAPESVKDLSFMESEIPNIEYKKMETKVCTRCGREMPLESFPKNNRSKDGHLSVCKDATSRLGAQHAPSEKKHRKAPKSHKM